MGGKDGLKRNSGIERKTKEDIVRIAEIAPKESRSPFGHATTSSMGVRLRNLPLPIEKCTTIRRPA